MAKSSTPGFIATIPLIVNSREESELLSRFQAGRQFYNAMLNEAMVRMNLVKNSAFYKNAKEQPKGKRRNEGFKTARQAYRFSEYDLQKPLAVGKGRV
jgi:putative transposase